MPASARPAPPSRPAVPGRPETAPDFPGWGRIIASLLPDLHCRRCNSTRWELAHPDEPDVIVGITYHRLPQLAPEGFTDCVPLICARCGGVEMFSKDHLIRWWRAPKDG